MKNGPGRRQPVMTFTHGISNFLTASRITTTKILKALSALSVLLNIKLF